MKKSDVIIIVLGTVLFIGLIATITYLICVNNVVTNIGVTI